MSKKIKVREKSGHGCGWSIVVVLVTAIPILMTSLMPYAPALIVSTLINLFVLMLSGQVLLQIERFK